MELTRKERGFLKRIQDWKEDYKVIHSDEEDLLLADLTERKYIELRVDPHGDCFIKSRITIK